ncbi:MAG TPA: ferredoxin [Ramlibacter sp.]|nr:ferredoxin [Ramlibacter sp.]
MVNITYIEPAGDAITLQIEAGWSLMQGAVTNGVDGIVGECGGSCVCATCHCYVETSRLAQLPLPNEEELELLSWVTAERKPNSRLACQLKAGPATDGLVVTIPAVQGLRS